MFKQIHWAWLIFFSCLITTFIYGSVRMSYSILMPEMIVALKISKSQAGAIASSFFFTYTILSPLSGFLVDRVSARKLITLGIEQTRKARAIDEYRKGKCTIWKASQKAGVSLREMIETVKRERIPLHLSPEDVEEAWNQALGK